MYDLMKDVKEKMQPAVDVAEINKKAAEKLFALQSEYVTDFVNSCVSQMKALTEIKEPSQAVELQMTYFKTLETKLADIAEKEYDALNEAKDQITEVVEKSLSDLRDNDYVSEMTKYMNDATDTVNQYMNEAAEAVAEAPVAKAAPAPAPAAKAAPAPAPVAKAAPAPAPVAKAAPAPAPVAKAAPAPAPVAKATPAPAPAAKTTTAAKTSAAKAATPKKAPAKTSRKTV